MLMMVVVVVAMVTELIDEVPNGVLRDCSLGMATKRPVAEIACLRLRSGRANEFLSAGVLGHC